MGDRPFVGGVEADCEGSAEPNRSHCDVACRVLSVDRSITCASLDQLVEDVACGTALFGPLVVVEERVHDVDGAEAAVDRRVQVPTQRLATGGSRFEGGSALPDRTVQDLDGDSSQQLWLVREVSVQRGDPHPGTLGHGISGRFAADLEHQLDRRVDNRLPVPSSVSAHRTAPGIASHPISRNGVYSSTSLAGQREDSVADEQQQAQMTSIAEAIEASGTTEYVPVTFDSCEHVGGPFFHGTKTKFTIGDELVPGQGSNYHEGRVANHVYFAALLEPAIWGAELAVALGGGAGRERVYIVEPTGPFEDDPNVTSKRFPGNVTQSYRTCHPMRILGEVESWEGHPPEILQDMLDNIAKLRADGLDVIED